MKRISRTNTLIALLMTALLSSCSHMRRGDGPPNYDVDVSHIKNPVPKPEPLAKYGNMPTYKVLGKRYYTMKSSNAFEQIGTASWYGTQFHEKRTSSGEPYDMLAMTAAHKTLPLPTYVEVTNLNNQRKIIVKVNDRGPFSSNRIIDLSYVAAKKLGMLGRGTAHVRIKALNPYTYASVPAKSVGRELRRLTPVVAGAAKTQPMNAARVVYLQAGAFANRGYAIKLKNRLASMVSYPVRIASPMANSKLYRVQIGPLHDNTSTNEVAEQLRSMGINAKKIQGA
jgi:rare lipoprotein A